jgi:hypothetical protein
MSMSSVSVGKTKGETYAFSWSMPAPNGGSDLDGTVLHSVPLGEEGNTDPVQQASEPVQLQDPYSSYDSPYEPARRFPAPSLRLLGVVAWSAVAGAGVVGAMMKFGAVLGMQVGEIGGLWLALGAAIWLVPPKVLK